MKGSNYFIVYIIYLVNLLKVAWIFCHKNKKLLVINPWTKLFYFVFSRKIYFFGYTTQNHSENKSQLAFSSVKCNFYIKLCKYFSCSFSTQFLVYICGRDELVFCGECTSLWTTQYVINGNVHISRIYKYNINIKNTSSRVLLVTTLKSSPKSTWLNVCMYFQ